MGDMSDLLVDDEMSRLRLAVLLVHFSRLDDDREPWRVIVSASFDQMPLQIIDGPQ